MKPVIFGLSGPTLTPEERAFFAEARPAGYILFKRNCVDRQQSHGSEAVRTAGTITSHQVTATSPILMREIEDLPAVGLVAGIGRYTSLLSAGACRTYETIANSSHTTHMRQA